MQRFKLEKPEDVQEVFDKGLIGRIDRIGDEYYFIPLTNIKDDTEETEENMKEQGMNYEDEPQLQMINTG